MYPDVGQPPAVDRLIVVAHQEHPVGRSGQELRQSELGPVQVLRLIHQQMGAARRRSLSDRALPIARLGPFDVATVRRGSGWIARRASLAERGAVTWRAQDELAR